VIFLKLQLQISLTYGIKEPEPAVLKEIMLQKFVGLHDVNGCNICCYDVNHVPMC
jgi:hypothetical protein